jgi:dsDNA-specific endonuclease/ATPase MutS2
MPKDKEIETLVFSTELNDDEISILDIHGYTVDQARYEIEYFISTEHAGIPRKDYKVIKIITGEGSGKLQEVLKSILTGKGFDFIEYYRYQMQPIPSNSVVYIVLAPNTKPQG